MFQENVLLSQYSSYRIGGPAKYFQEIKTREELAAAVKEIKDLKVPFFILGGGTNLLFSDNGFAGAVLKISLTDLEEGENSEVSAGAGLLMSDFLNFTIQKSLSGLEWAGGLPGTVGGAVRGNAGAFAGETKDSVVSVESLRLADLEFRTRTNEECRFSYRSSIFKEKEGEEIIIGAEFSLKPGNSEEVKKAIFEKIQYRRDRQPLEYPNAGSVFKNVDLRMIPPQHLKKVENAVKKDPFPVVPTAFLLSECGLKGMRHGGAMVSPKHPNFIINYEGATAADVKALISLAKEKVFEKFGVSLNEEVLIFE